MAKKKINIGTPNHKIVITNITPIANTDVCYVCGAIVRRETQDYWEAPPTKKHPDGVIRHANCEAGSENWMKSKYGEISSIAVYFKNAEEKKMEKAETKKTQKTVVEKLVKEFTGRVKYLVYMDSKSGDINIPWAVSVNMDGVVLHAEGGNSSKSTNITINNKVIPYQSKDTLNERIIKSLNQ